MTRDEIHEVATEATAEVAGKIIGSLCLTFSDARVPYVWLEAFAAKIESRARAEERELCVKDCKDQTKGETK